MNKSLMNSALFTNFSTEREAYALGVFSASEPQTSGERVLRLAGNGEPILQLLYAQQGVSLAIESGQKTLCFAPELCVQAEPQLVVALNSLSDDNKSGFERDLVRAFARGAFDCLAHVSPTKRGKLVIRMDCLSVKLINALVSFFELVPDESTGSTFYWRSTKALDLLGLLYEPSQLSRPYEQADLSENSEHAGLEFYRPKNMRRYLSWTHCIAGIEKCKAGEMRVQRLRPDAQLPQKQRVSDSGYDLTILSEKKRFGTTVLYGTGLIVEPPQGWYFDIVPRSSIIKKGYLLANNVGVIDRAYRGELMIPLVKVDPNAPDIELPSRIAQLIPRPIVHMRLSEVASLTDTARGAGGFGSSGS